MHPRDLASLAGEETIFGGFAAEKLERLQAELEPLSGRYDVVVANPPYMGSKNMNKWLGDWVKTHHKDVKGDLFSCFMVRNVGMGAEHAQLGFMTPYVWMFIGTYEKLRKFVIQQNTITSLIQLEYSGFSGATVPICTFTLQKGYCPGYRGGYVRLSDFVGADQQAPRALEALANPDCGWFYRADASEFEAIPGSPIAYWASKTALDAFSNSDSFSDFVTPKSGFSTGDNDKFIHFWWELNWQSFCIDCASLSEANLKTEYWFPLNKGGGFRKWYGNNLFAVNWRNNAFEMKKCSGYRSGCERYYFHKGLTWGTISSSLLSVRYSPIGYMPNRKGAMAFPDIEDNLYYGLGLLNSSTAMYYLRFLAPTLDFSEGPVGALPFIEADKNTASAIVREAIEISQCDYDSFEDSWDFERHPLI